MTRNLVTEALAAWQAAAETKQAAEDEYRPDPLTAAVDRLLALDPRPPEVAAWPALTAAVEAEFAQCHKLHDAEILQSMILWRPRPCGHTRDDQPPWTCPFCIMLTDTVRNELYHRVDRLVRAGNQFAPDWQVSFADDHARHAYAKAYRRWSDGQETMDDLITLADGALVWPPNAKRPAVRSTISDPGSKITTQALPARFGSSTLRMVDRGSRIVDHLARLVQHGPLALSKTEWGDRLNTSAKTAGTVLSDTEALRARGLTAREFRPHGKPRLIEVRQESAPEDQDKGTKVEA